MNNEQKLQVATDALKALARRNQSACWNSNELKEAQRALAILAAPSTEQQKEESNGLESLTEFKRWLKLRGLDPEPSDDTWGGALFKYTHIQAMWEGWVACGQYRGVPSPSTEQPANAFRQHLADCSAKVATWPAWKGGPTEQPAGASVDGDPKFQQVMLQWASDWCREERRKAAVDFVNAWGAQQREAGRRDEHGQCMKALEHQAADHVKERDDLRARLAATKAQAFDWASALNECARLLNFPAGVLQTDVPKYLSAQLARPADLAGQEPKHPMQPVVLDSVGTLRFKENAIVRFLATNRLNELACMEFSDADREQLVQLIGYSVSGTSNFEFVSDEVYEAAQAAGEALLPSAK